MGNTENGNKIILDLCGGTGAWSRFYKEAGYDVRVITLPEYDVTKTTFDGTYIVFRGSKLLVINIADTPIYGILAAPPCTEFSRAKGSQPRDFESAMKVVNACLRIIWTCRLRGNLKFWAMENPVGFLRQFLGIPKYQFEQWQFGENKIKPTDLWGYFNPPRPSVGDKPKELYTILGKTSHSVMWSKAVKLPKEFAYLDKLPYNEKRAAIRAITPPGFAEAFYKANK